MFRHPAIIFGILIILGLVGFLLIPEEKIANDGKIHVQYWLVSGMKDELPLHATEFNKSQDKIVVDCTPLPWNENEKKILTSVLSGDPPDIIFLVTPVAKWASRYALTPLDDLIKRDRFDSSVFFTSLWNEMKYQGSTFAIPLYSGSYALFYNKRLFREAGLDPAKPPKTWDAVVEMNKKLIKTNAKGQITQMGYVPHYGNVETAMLMVNELKGQILSADGKTVNLHSPEMLKALEWTVDFYKTYPQNAVSQFTAGFGFAEQHGFTAEKLAMMVLDNSFPEQLKLYNPGLDYGITYIPTFPGCSSTSSAGSWWIAIPRGAKHPQEAWEFIKYAVKKETQIAEALHQQELLLFPANRLAANDTAFQNISPHNKIFTDLMDLSFSPSVIPMAHDVFWREFMNAQDLAINRILSPEDALKHAELNIQKQLDLNLSYDTYVRSKMSMKAPL